MRVRRFVFAAIGAAALAWALTPTVLAADQDKPDPRHTACQTTVNYPLPAGGGVNSFNVCISDHGNLLNFVSPSADQILQEGFRLCVPAAGTSVAATYTDRGLDHTHWAAPLSITQPGPNLLPLTIVRRTNDNLWEMKQVFTAKDNNEQDIAINVTLKRLGPPVGGSYSGGNHVYFSRYVDTTIWGDDGFDVGMATTNGIFAGDFNGLTLTGLTRTFAMQGFVMPYGTVTANPTSCTVGGWGPTAPGDLEALVTYALSSFKTGQSKTFKFVYARK